MRAEKKFFRGVISILDSVQKDDDCISQINMIFKKLTEHYLPLTERYNSSLDILEELITIYKTSAPKDFKRRYSLELSPKIMDKLHVIRNSMKEQQPFSSIPAKEANLLNMLKSVITTDNAELGLNTLNQLADEIEIMEGNVQTLNKKMMTSSIISILGVILTLFFGIIAFLQFLRT
ncbi:MAG: hypothetical protein WBE22_07815 [Halobacteriota archaeon]